MTKQLTEFWLALGLSLVVFASLMLNIDYWFAEPASTVQFVLRHWELYVVLISGALIAALASWRLDILEKKGKAKDGRAN